MIDYTGLDRRHVLKGLSPDYLAYGVAATHDSEVLVGRPKGGLAILWHKSISNICKFVAIPGTTRACALDISLGDENLVVANLYLPVDNQSKTSVSQELIDVFDEVELFVRGCHGKHLIIGGDMNLDIARHNAHDELYKVWCDRIDCTYVHDLPGCEISYTYNDPSNNCFTCIDHFTVSKSLLRSISGANVCYESLNPSKHSPVVLNIKYTPDRVNLVDGDNTHRSSVAWYKVKDHHINSYQMCQDQYLAEMNKFDVIYCSDTKCVDEEHRRQIDHWCDDLVQCCLSSERVLPSVNAVRQCRPGWSSEVKPYRDDCMFWHKLWIEAGSPRTGVLYDVMKYTKKTICMPIGGIREN